MLHLNHAEAAWTGAAHSGLLRQHGAHRPTTRSGPGDGLLFSSFLHTQGTRMGPLCSRPVPRARFILIELYFSGALLFDRLPMYT